MSVALDHVVYSENELVCLYCKNRYPIGLPCSVGMMIAITRQYHKDHKGCKKPEHLDMPKTPDEWLQCGDTGVSSKTIWAVMTNRGVSHYDIPYDPSDFGRCYRLLNLFPAWRGRLPEVAARFPRWRGFVEHWVELTALYEEELKNSDGRAPKLYARMQEIRKETR